MTSIFLASTHASAPPSPGAASEVPFRLALVNPPTELNPRSYLSLPEWYIHANLTSALVKLDGSNQVVSDLAEKWEVVGDGRVYRLRLSTNRKWSDGSPIKPEEILNSFTSHAIHKNASILKKVLKPGPVAQAIYLEAPQTLVFHLGNSIPNFLYHLARPEFGVIDSSSLSPQGLVTATTRTSGPYRIASLEAAELVLEKNPFYRQIPSASPNRVSFAPIKGQDRILAQVKAGNLDFYEAQSDDILSAAEASGHYLIVNGGLDNLATLQARKLTDPQLETLRYLASAIDRAAFLNSEKRSAQRLVAYSEVPPANGPLSGPSSQNLPHRNFAPLTLTLGSDSTSDQRRDAEILKGQAEKLGIPFRIEIKSTSLRPDWESENYGLTLARMGVYAYDEAELIHGYFCAGFKPYQSLRTIACEEINRAVHPGTQAEARKEALRQAYSKLSSSGKLIPLYHFPRKFLIHNRWKTVDFNPLVPFPSFLRFQRR